jgi:hypothetical protein
MPIDTRLNRSTIDRSLPRAAANGETVVVW